MQASTRGFARFGLFILGGGMINGKPILPDGWIEAATTNQAGTYPGSEYSYGYQWWTLDNGDSSARGIFGQGIFIDPKMNLIIVSNSNWPNATDAQGGDQGRQRFEFYRQVQQAIDREAK